MASDFEYEFGKHKNNDILVSRTIAFFIEKSIAKTCLHNKADPNMAYSDGLTKT